MSSFTFLLVCIQACLIQNVFSQCRGAYGPAAAVAPAALSPVAPCGYDAGIGGLAYPGAGLAGRAYTGADLIGAYPGAGFAGAGLADFAYPGAGFAGSYPGAGLAPYGGAGEGNVAVAGELPVAGNTAIAGQVPIMGAVRFDGAVPAAGAVSISGNCACGCGSPYLY